MSRVWTWTVIGFWALAMGVLIREKVMPELLQTYYPSYQTLLQTELSEERYQMGIFSSGQARESRIGVSRTTIEALTAEGAGDAAFSISNDTIIDLSGLAMNIGSDLRIQTTTRIDARYRVLSHTVVIKTGLGDFRVDGVVKEENRMQVTIQSPLSATEHKELEFDNAMTLANGLSPFLMMPKLRIGRQWTIHQIDPVSLVMSGSIKTKPLLATVEKMERIHVEGRDIDAFVVSLKSERYQATSWIGEDGRILMEKVPFMTGMTLTQRREAWTEK